MKSAHGLDAWIQALHGVAEDTPGEGAEVARR